MTVADDFLASRLDPASTALLLIDFQNDFCAPGGFYDTVGNSLEKGQEAARRAAAFMPRAREEGVLVVLVRCVYDAPYVSDTMREWYDHKGFPLEYCRDGTWGAEFYEVQPEPGDIVVTKHRYSAFVDTELQAVLRSNRIENLLLAGVATNVCVESTARDAFMYDYRVTVLSDCTGTYSQALYEATLENMHRAFGTVATSDEVSALWTSLRSPSPAR
ncbi:MAG TPA: isochorismatase family cysteine hydrolase [Thermoleophilaceae bacterium]|nr:isochorismatase family cysteine hydrolase [Thermoleophilaceae bacterium]